MSLASWILDRFLPRRPKRAELRRTDEIVLYLRRLEDRRVLSVTAVSDAYFVESFSTPLTASDQLGVLGNDLNGGGDTLQAVEGTFATDLGGTVVLNPDGGFTYSAPTDVADFFIDGFAYTATNGSEFSNLGFVTFYVGDVPVDAGQPALLPIFGVESGTPFDFVQVDLMSSAGASLRLSNTTGISFGLGSNGDSDISISGSAEAVNKALDSLEYTSPVAFTGTDQLRFSALVQPGGNPPLPPLETNLFVPIFVEPAPITSDSLVAVDDLYYLEPFQSGVSFSPTAGLLSNDFSTERGSFFASPVTITTPIGGTVDIFSDGSFSYAPPQAAPPVFIDSFVYFTSDGMSFSNPGFVTLFVGEVPVPSNPPTPLPIFVVDTPFQDDLVEVTLISSQGASLTLLDDSFLDFTNGSNGGSDISFRGTVGDVNRALDTLEYDPFGFTGNDDLVFSYTIMPPPQQSITTATESLNPPPPPSGGLNPPPEGQNPPPGNFQIVPIFVAPPSVPGDVVTVDDEYFVDAGISGIFFSQQAGVVSNDFSPSDMFLFADPGPITTSLGGIVNMNTDGSFFYTPPDDPFLGPVFVDSFTYFATNDGETLTPGFATIFVGAVPMFEDQPLLFPVFTTESETPMDLVTVQLTSAQGSSLRLLDTFGITFDPSTANGDSTIIFSGMAEDVNFALDLLAYAPPLNYSGGDLVVFEYKVFNEPFAQAVPINVLPFADPPLLSITPPMVNYLPVIPVPVDITVTLIDMDGSEIPGLIVLQNVPQGVIPSVGQRSPVDPGTYFLLPGELENLFFFVDFAAPEFFTIDVIATSIETTPEPGVFGGPGGPLLPDHPFDPRFAASVFFLDFVRLPMPDVPPPPPPKPIQNEVIFLLGPLSSPPPAPPKVHDRGDRKSGPDAPVIVASVFESGSSSQSQDTSTSPVLAVDGPEDASSDAVTSEERNEDQSRRSSEEAGIYVRKLGSDDPNDIAKLPPELSEDYPAFMAFLKTLPNGDYVVYFKQGGQPHEQAQHRQVVVRVRVVNHRLNPDSGEFKPAGEVAEPPRDPNAEETPSNPKAPPNEKQVRIPEPHWITPQWTTGSPAPALNNTWTPIAAGAGIAAFAGWRLHLHHEGAKVDRLMERFAKRKPSRRLLRGIRL